MICELEAQHNEARGSLRRRRDRAPGPPTASGRPRDRRLHDRTADTEIAVATTGAVLAL